METKIINLVGASGSGKDTIAKELVNRGYHDIPSYTTREPREKDEWGHTFIENEVLVGNTNPITLIEYTEDGNNIEHDNMIAYFNSYKSGHHYFATDEQVKRGKTNIYRVDPLGAEMVKEFYKGTDVKVITIYLESDEEIRKERLYKRAKDKNYVFNKQDNVEVWERLLPDREVFSIVKCDYTVNANASIDKVVGRIEQILKRRIMKKIKVKYFSEDYPRLEKIEIGNWIDLRADNIKKWNGEDIDTRDRMRFGSVKYNKGDVLFLGLGIAMELPKGYEAYVVPRSSTFKNTGLMLTNGVGIIDEAYCGDNDEWGAMVIATRSGKFDRHDRLFQFRIQKAMGDIEIEEVEHLGNEDRGGYGSTGRR